MTDQNPASTVYWLDFLIHVLSPSLEKYHASANGPAILPVFDEGTKQCGEAYGLLNFGGFNFMIRIETTAQILVSYLYYRRKDLN
jgi:hypothetical protein